MIIFPKNFKNDHNAKIQKRKWIKNYIPTQKKLRGGVTFFQGATYITPFPAKIVILSTVRNSFRISLSTLESGINIALRLLIFWLFSRGYAYSFCQIFQGLRLFKGLRLFQTLEYFKGLLLSKEPRVLLAH